MQQNKVSASVHQRKQVIERQLISTGQMQKLEDYLRKKLIESGWKDDLKKHCKDVIRQRGMESVKIEDLMEEIRTRGKHTINPKIKTDIVNRIKSFVENQPTTNNDPVRQ